MIGRQVAFAGAPRMFRPLVLAAADLLALAASWALALWGYWAVGIADYDPGWTIYLRFWPVGVAFVLVNACCRLYQGDSLSPAAQLLPHEERWRLMLSSLGVHLTAVAVLVLARQTLIGYSRAVFLMASVLTALLSQPFRDLSRRVLRRLSLGQVVSVTVGELMECYRAGRGRDLGSDAPEPDGGLFKAPSPAIVAALETADVVLPLCGHGTADGRDASPVAAASAEDLACVRQALAERHPDYLPACDAVAGRLSCHRHTLFALRRLLLDRFCAWLFEILGVVERRLGEGTRPADGSDVLAGIAEVLLDVWIERNDVRSVECPAGDRDGRTDGIALLHYWLTNRRGGEHVFEEICSMFPYGDVYTHAHDPRVVPLRASHRVHETLIARLPFGRLLPQIYLPLMPGASRLPNLKGCRLIVSSESGPIKGIRKPKGSVHVCYCHTPMRYVWDLYDEYYRAASLPGKALMRLFRDYLRHEDVKSAASVDLFLANSHFVAERIRRLYRRDAPVIYPPVDCAYFSALRAPRSALPSPSSSSYLFVGQLVCYKRADLAILACRKLGRRLRIVGVGGQAAKLRALASGDPNIEFVGRIGKEALRDEYVQAKALLFPGLEDFGIVPVEAQAAGTPVIAYGKGGALETVTDLTGVFFSEQTVEAVCGAIEEFESRTWSSDACRAQAEKFRPEVFRQAFRAAVESVVRTTQSVTHGSDICYTMRHEAG